MIKSLTAFVLGGAFTGVFGWGAMVFFRKIKMGVSSPYLPDRKNLNENKKTTGGSFAALFGSCCAVLGVSPFCTAGEIALALCSLMLCASACFLGFCEDRLVDLKGKNVGLKGWQRVFFLLLMGICFSAIYLALGGNTAVSLPFSAGGLRLKAFFCPAVGGVTVLLCEGFRLSAQTDGVIQAQSLVHGCALWAICAVSAESGEMLLPAAFAGAALAALLWGFPPAVLKTGLSDKYLFAAMLVSACLVTQNEGSLLFLGAFEVLCLAAYPVDKWVYKFFKRRIFARLPVDKHLESCRFSKMKIFAFYIIFTLIFSAIGIFMKFMLK